MALINTKAQDKGCDISVETVISLFDLELSKSDIQNKLDCYNYKGVRGMAEFRIFQMDYQRNDSDYYDRVEVPMSFDTFTKDYIVLETSDRSSFWTLKDKFLKYGFEVVRDVKGAAVYRYENLEIQTIVFHESSRYIVVLRKGNKGQFHHYKSLDSPLIFLRKAEEYKIILEEK